MNGQRREQFKGIYPGPYRAWTPTRTDAKVTAEGPDGPVVVGRFYATKTIDAKAQADAYAMLPDMIDLLKMLARNDYPGSNDAFEILQKAGIEL
jgi:hypothetical protein